MESSGESDDSLDDGPHYSRMKQPPLIKQLRKILDEYPDDGQILKEIIQNAEDAEATEMEIWYDRRCVNQENVKPFQKYFKGPALCVYNNAEFTKEDWKGIQMINSSVKEFDPVKIGRFGLGFKSVFHITDYPMIISKNHMLILDPHQRDPERVCILMKLNKIKNYTKEIDVSNCLAALGGIFGFSEGTLDSGIFEGTLFRFPLRSETTSLSDNVYNQEKILDLFNAFQAEASVELLFLKCLEKINLHFKDPDELYCREDAPFFTVQISENYVKEARTKRQQLHRNMKTVGNSLAKDSFISNFKMAISTTDTSGERVEKEWIIIHCLKGGAMSKELITLSKDESLSYIPFVSIALPINPEPEFKGHVFCLMPLPLEDESLTGFPVHVNGYFALSQNRRHVKWPTADQTKNKAHTDKAIRWNQCLVIEVLADVYYTLIRQMITTCTENNNNRDSISILYRCIPDHRRITNHWELILNPLFSRLLLDDFLFTENNGGKWIKSTDAVFNIFKEDTSDDIKRDVLQLARLYGMDLVDVPDHITSLLHFRNYPVQKLTPKFVLKYLKSNARYKNMNNEEKLSILSFLLSGKKISPPMGLELVPLENGTFGMFEKRGGHGKRIIVGQGESELFPGQEEMFCRHGIGCEMNESLYEMAETGIYQLYTFDDLTSDEIVSLLLGTIRQHIGKTSDQALHWKTSGSDVTGKKWLGKIWKFLQSYDLEDFSHLHLVPNCQPGKKDLLFKISTTFLLRSHPGYNELPISVCRALNCLDICVLNPLPKIIMAHDDISKFVYFPTVDNVIRMIKEIESNKNHGQLIQKFNKNGSKEEKREFAKFIGRHVLPNSTVANVVSRLEIFKEKKTGRYVSASQVRIVTEAQNLPVEYHKDSLDCTEPFYGQLAKNLNVTIICQQDVIEDMLLCLQKGKPYSLVEMNQIMRFVMNKLSIFSDKQAIIKIARNISFVPNGLRQLKKALDLFDPEDDTLTTILVNCDHFPDARKCPISIKQLRKLGLKSADDLTGEDLLKCAQHIETTPQGTSAELQSAKILECLHKKPSLLRCHVGNRKSILSDQLSNVHFIKPSNRRDSFPASLPWFNGSHTFCRPVDLLDPMYSNLVGSVQPVLQHNFPSEVSKTFGWNRKPSIKGVIEQLLVVIEWYEDKQKPQLLPLISDIYNFLANTSVSSNELSSLKTANWLWTGYGFETIENVILTSQSNDISLIPYVYTLPPEFQQLQNFFVKMNCVKHQTDELLIRVLHTIQDKYVNNVTDECEVKTDLQVVVKILNNLKDNIGINLDRILLPVHTHKTNQMILKPVKECNYCDDDWLKGAAEEDGDEICYVHKDIPHDTAVKLGVSSLTDKLLEFTEGIEEWGQTEPLTRRIHNLLKDYKDGLSVPKEIVQNADDAGATKVCFMYDERENTDCKTKLLDNKMASCQGPALWAYNDAVFTPKDLENITKLSGATKETDNSKIGKFGLGFCSVYNLTDVPSFVTENHIVIFDPHTTYLGSALRNKNQPGIKIDTRTNQTVLKRMSSQFEPYNGVFGCNLNSASGTTSFNGTLFRFPLRTKQQLPSDISDTIYDHDEMIRLMKIFVEACGNLVLFTQNVSQIEFYHLPCSKKDPSKASLLYSIRKNITHKIERPFGKSRYQKNELSILKDMSKSLSMAKQDSRQKLMTVEISILQEISISIGSNLKDFGIEGKSSNSAWFVTWASGTDMSKHIALNSVKKGVLPLGSVACLVENVDGNVYRTCNIEQSPFGFYQTSHVFCYLPLPVETQFPVHINGSFAVSSDRRRLACKTTDDKDSFDSEWNDALICDAVCNAYIVFLENLKSLPIDPNEHYYQQWPVQDTVQGNFTQLKNSFYRKLSNEGKEYVVFRREEKAVCLNKCRFLDPNLMETTFADKAFEMCIYHVEDDGRSMMELPISIANCFRNVGCESSIKNRILNVVTFYSVIVFPFLTDDVWDTAAKIQMIIYALDKSNSCEELSELLKMHRCIPTAPNKHFRRPEELVDRNGKVGMLFTEEDGRFIDLSEPAYSTSERIRTLGNLGMITDTLSGKLLLDRARSVQYLQDVNHQQALDRCKNVLKYIARKQQNIEQDQEVLKELQDTKFLPVKRKPKDWKWNWGGEKSESPDMLSTRQGDDRIVCEFECPSKLYCESVWELVCSSKSVVDRERLPFEVNMHLLKMLGVKTDDSVNLHLVMTNLTSICQLASNEAHSTDELEILSKVTLSSYKWIDRLFRKNMLDDELIENLSQVMDSYKDVKLVLLNGMFVQPCQLVVDISEDCSPYLYGLNTALHLRSLHGFLRLLRINERCSKSTVLTVLVYIHDKHGSDPMPEDTVKVYVKLLNVLVESTKLDNLTTNEVKDLYIPDTKGVLTLINKLCVDEVRISSMETMRFTHPSISFEIAFALGINSKRVQKVEECSKPMEIYSKDFGQHEELVTRIKRILSGYPCDVGVLKELLQNADDAKASEVHIVADFSHYGTENLFADSWVPLQGPALLVYNDSSFSEADIKGIQCLGIGSKGDDPTKTGQYGVGFNAVYHLTDVPSFLTRGEDVETGELLCVMDPHCKFVPKSTAENPGRQYFKTDVLKEDYPNVFRCYRDDLLMKEKGTIFRLPLRTSEFAPTSKISSNEITEQFVRNLISKFQDELKEILLFVNNVQTVRLSEIVGDHLEERYVVNIRITDADESKRRTFYHEIKTNSKKIRQSQNPDYVAPLEVKYMVGVYDSLNIKYNWLIVRRMGFSGRHELPKNVKKAYTEGELGVLPRGGVAVHIPDDLRHMEVIKGRIFCFLPLPLETGMPVHINGHFVLDHEARRNLWTEEHESYRSAWNKHLMSDIIAPAYASALHTLREHLGLQENNSMKEDVLRQKLNVYHTYWPDVANGSNEYFKFLACSIYQWISIAEETLFPCCKFVGTSEGTVTFFPLICSEMTFPCIFNTFSAKTQSVDTALSTVTKVCENISQRLATYQRRAQDSEYRATESKQWFDFTRICKDLGMKLLDTPFNIMCSLEKAKVDVIEISPDFLMSFLKSFESPETDKCDIGEINKSVATTTFQGVEDILICLRYCQQSPTFENQVDGLPLCLTNDDILRVFSKENPVFCSKFSHILKESSSCFLHLELVSLLSTNTAGLKQLDIPSFTKLLYYTLSAEKYRTHNQAVVWEPQGSVTPNKYWIEDVWKFLNSTVLDFYKQNTEQQTCNKATIIEQSIMPLSPWCLVPCTDGAVSICSDYDNYKPVLFPINKLTHVLDISTFSGDMKQSLDILSLPRVDNIVATSDTIILKETVAIHDKPISILNYLYQYRDQIHHKKVKIADCYEIMGFITEHLDTIIKESEETLVLDRIKAIPLHVNINKHNISIQGHSSVLVLDSIVSKDIVLDGIESWASESGTILIKSSHKLKKLYAKLGLTNENPRAIEVYTNYLLPKFNCLPRNCHIAHLKHIEDKLLANSCGFDNHQKSMIKVLKTVSFVPDKQNNLYRASHFKSPFNTLMKTMCDDDDFPKESFMDISWQYLLELAGIQTVVTKDMIVKFARIIERSGRNEMTKDIETKSKMLILHILSRPDVTKECILREISEICFVVRFRIIKWKNDIFKESSGNLICYSKSVPQSQENLCWTTCSILPDFANPQTHKPTLLASGMRKQMLDQLNVYREPELSNVIKHMQNVSDSLKQFADNDQLRDNHVIKIKDVMIQIYSWLNDKKETSSEALRKGLLHKPIVFLPIYKLFVTCDRVVKSLQTQEEIKPYLVEVPEEYGAYFKLFEILGMNVYANICNFVRVLAHLKLDVGDTDLHVNDFKLVQKALQGICCHLDNITEDLVKELSSMDTLYLPTRDKVLQNARCIVLSDNEAFEERVGGDIGMPYMMSLMDLEIISVGIVALAFKKLPQKLQPNILSDLIKPELNECSLTITYDEKGKQLCDFMTSPQFLEAVVRIAVHSRRKNPYILGIKDPDVGKIISSLEQLKIIQVHSIQLKLVFNGKPVGFSERNSYFHTKEIENRGKDHVLLCAFKDKPLEKWLVDNCRTIWMSLMVCTDNEFSDVHGLLFKILQYIKNPDDISKALDEEEIPQYSIANKCTTSIFPPAGTTVHPDWHCYLDNSFVDFDNGEYVALFLNEETMKGNIFIPALYIYAIIVGKCDATPSGSILERTRCLYDVEVGKKCTEKKRAYDLYKFNRKTQETSTDLAPFLDIADGPKDDRNIDDILREVKEIIKDAWTLPEDERKKVIKRLYKKWHPDKNHGNEGVATKVFQFIKQIVFRMESGEDINTDSSSHYEPPKDSYFRSHFRTWDQDARHDTNRNKRRGRRGRSSRNARRQPTEPVPSYHEGRQWMKQAKVDLVGATEFLSRAETGPNFNLICIICYQSVEKALKAIHYQRDSNKVPGTNILTNLLEGLDAEICVLVNRFTELTGSLERMMYPDRLCIPRIPSDMYNRTTATEVVKKTKEILDLISDRL